MDAKHTPSRIVFLSFADKRYAGALNSLKECTEHFPFDEMIFLLTIFVRCIAECIGAALAIGGGKLT